MVLTAASTAVALLSAQTASDVALPSGDAARGKAIVEGKGKCLGCHRVGDVGSLYGPELNAIGAAPRAGGTGRGGGGRAGAAGNLAASPGGPTRQQLAQSILDPNAEMPVQNRYVRLTMNDGRTVWGKLLNLDTFDVQIFDSTEKLANVSRKDVREMTVASPMPSYRDTLTPQELADVIEYLMLLK
jgi:mono/diheme cytochrome c family protein